MKNKLLLNLSANAVQLIVNQLCGLVIFYILSTQLDKNSFGKLNLVLAIMLVVFNLLTLGIDQVLIKKIANHQPLQNILSIYFSHVLFSGLFFYVILLFCSFFINPGNELYPLLLVIGAGKLMIYFTTPFKTMASGLERFKLLAYMLILSNVARSLGLLILAIFKIVSLRETMLFFIMGDIVEFVVCLYLFKRNIKVPITINLDKKSYFALIHEAMPQTGVIIITAIMARLDWIFIGIMVSAIKLAEYSFAYKIFEIATLPLLAIAPILLPWLTKLFNRESPQLNSFKPIIKAELIVAMISFLALNILWVPVIEFITDGKYGSINMGTIFFLSLSLPFLYVNNLMWTIYFTQGRLKMILFGFILLFLVNISLNLILIPFFANEGAAIALLAATIVQTIYYLSKNQLQELHSIWKSICICLICALASGFFFRQLLKNELWILLLSILLFIALLFVTGQLKWRDGKRIIQLFKS